MQEEDLKRMGYKLAKVRGAIAGITELVDKMNDSYNTYRDELEMYVDLINKSIEDVTIMLHGIEEETPKKTERGEDGMTFKPEAVWKAFENLPKPIDGAEMKIQLEPGEKIRLSISADKGYKGYVDTEHDPVEDADEDEDEECDEEECEHNAYTSYEDIPLFYTEDAKSEDDDDEEEKTVDDKEEKSDEDAPSFDVDFDNWLDWLGALTKNLKKPTEETDDKDKPRYTKDEFIAIAMDVASTLGKAGMSAENIEKTLINTFSGRVADVKDDYVKRMCHTYANITSKFGKGSK